MSAIQILSIGLISFALLTAPGLGAPADADSPECRDIPNAQERGEQFRRKLVAIQKAGSAPTIGELKKQLERKQCDLKLQPPAPDTLSPAELYAQHRDAVAVVGALAKCGRCSKWHLSKASGFFISEDGILVSNHHVIANKDDDDAVIGAMTYGGDVFPVTEVLASDADADLVLMRVDGNGFQSLRLSKGCRVGDPVWVLSHPSGRYFYLTNGMVSGIYQRGDKANTTRLDITADFGIGSSGAPVLDASGNVVGVASSTSPVMVNSTHSKARDDTKQSSKSKRPAHAQMVFRQCIPVDSIRALCK